MKYLIFMIIATCSIKTSANEISPTAQINRLITYEHGDVFVSLTTNGSVCSWGYWIDEQSKGYQSVLSALLAAYYSKKPVSINADEQQRWSGSSNYTCKIYALDQRHS